MTWTLPEMSSATSRLDPARDLRTIYISSEWKVSQGKCAIIISDSIYLLNIDEDVVQVMNHRF